MRDVLHSHKADSSRTPYMSTAIHTRCRPVNILDSLPQTISFLASFDEVLPEGPWYDGVFLQFECVDCGHDSHLIAIHTPGEVELGARVVNSILHDARGTAARIDVWCG